MGKYRPRAGHSPAHSDRNNGANANGHPDRPAPFDDDEAARIVWRTALTRESPTAAEAARLDPSWGEGALLAEDQGAEGVGFWFNVQAARLKAQPDRLAIIRKALDAAKADPLAT